jgi:hypothetical protein
MSANRGRVRWRGGRVFRGALVVLSVGLVAIVSAGSAAAVTRKTKVINGVTVDQYTWIDSAGRPRTVSLKRQRNGNPGNGGYAVQMTYRTPANNPVIVDEAPGEGFGYFVSHERYRNFEGGGAADTIAHKVFNANDSPLGRNIAVVGKALNLNNPAFAAHRFTTTYPRYGTIDPIPKDANGNDVELTPTDPNALALYTKQITITWYFQDGTDYPRIEFRVGFGDVPGPDRVQFDVRGPYGVMRFDNGRDRNVDRVIWGDRYHFATLGKPATRDSAWVWHGRNKGARYNALIAGNFEMGLFEPRPFKDSALRDSWAEERGSRSSVHNNGNGCKDANQLIPCDWAWAYQSLQYSLPYNNNAAPTNYKKIAWGSSPFYGTGPSMTVVWDSLTTTQKFNGFPASGKIIYSICVVLGLTVPNGLTRQAAAGPDYDCAGQP